MKTKHTPGPWTRPSAPYYIGAGNPKKLVAQAFGETAEEIEANARLIAAAPDLLEACLEAGRALDGCAPAVEAMLRAAIIKATGKAPAEILEIA